MKLTSRISQTARSLWARALKLWHYLSRGVWRDSRQLLWVKAVKAVNLTIKSFMSVDLQSTACALTYRLLLALVPALALLFAIGRGFGFQNLLKTQLFSYFPAQQKALETAITFVDSYLAQASEGLFVGVGIVVLLWTLISLVGAVEDAFNRIWGIKHGRTLWRKITDYTAIFLILPILMVCGSGITVFMSSTIEDYLPFMTPLVTWLLDVASVVLIWLFFTGLYMLVPNTKVKFRNALPAGILAGIAYQVLQALFVSGQLYVSKYNAIYGGFAFLPLLLIWMQLVWLFTLTGALLCYSAQSVSEYTMEEDVNSIAYNYKRRVLAGLLAVIVQRYEKGLQPLTATGMERSFGVPLRLVTNLLLDLEQMGLVSRVIVGKDQVAYQPARDLHDMTIGQLTKAYSDMGASGMVAGFDAEFKAVDTAFDHLEAEAVAAGSQPLSSLALPSLGGKPLQPNQP